MPLAFPHLRIFLAATDTIHALLSFRDNKTTLLLCTSQAARGLDLPAVSHVFSLGCPEDAAQYLHRAGRTGRIGSMAGETSLHDFRPVGYNVSRLLPSMSLPPQHGGHILMSFSDQTDILGIRYPSPLQEAPSRLWWARTTSQPS